MPHADDLGILWNTPPRVRGAPIFTPRPLPPSTWQTPSPSDLPQLRSQGIKRISFDVETCDPDLLTLGPGTKRGAYIVGIALGTDDGRRWYFPTRHAGGGNMDEAQVRRWALEELNQFDGEIVGAHLLYDLEHAAASYNVTFPNARGFHDVLLAEPLIDEWRPGFSLDDVCGYHGIEGKEQTLMAEAAACLGGWRTEAQIKGNLWQLPAAYAGAYGEGDADRPLRVLAAQEPILAAEGLNDVYDVERGLLPMLLAMRQRGVPVNVARAEQVHARMVQERDEHLARLKHLAGPQAELMAPDSFAKALQERGLQIPRTAKTGKLSITKGWLKLYEGRDALVDCVLAGRRVNKIVNTYTGNILNYNIDGRIFSEFPQLKGEDRGTIARFSSAHPSLQNLPARDEELGPLTRSIFEPEDGEVWNSIDLSQIEFRILVHLSAQARDKAGRRLQGAEEARTSYINDPSTDFHALTATMIGVDPTDKIARKRVKNVNFGAVYMGGEETLARTIGCSVQEAHAFLQTYHSKLPFVRQIGLLAMDRAKEKGYIKTLLGRRQRFTLFEPRGYANKGGTKQQRKEHMLPYEQALKAFGPNIQRAFCHAGLNRGLQGSAADILKKGMKDIWDSGVCDVLGPILITIHDENCFSVARTKEALEAAAEARRCMENSIKISLPLRADCGVGPNWGACA